MRMKPGRRCSPSFFKADQVGKQYLPDLFTAGFPVTPTVDAPGQFHRLPQVAQYAVKPKLGADSVGLRFLTREEVLALDAADWAGMLVQPRIDFVHEVSFYFVDHDFQYALYAPAPRSGGRQPCEVTDVDLVHPQVHRLNDIEHGIQRWTPAVPARASCCSSSSRTNPCSPGLIDEHGHGVREHHGHLDRSPADSLSCTGVAPALLTELCRRSASVRRGRRALPLPLCWRRNRSSATYSSPSPRR